MDQAQQFPQFRTAVQKLTAILAITAFSTKPPPMEPSVRDTLFLQAKAAYDDVCKLLVVLDAPPKDAPAAPFTKPVFMEANGNGSAVHALKAADCELICMVDSATGEERDYIVNAINAYNGTAVPQLGITEEPSPTIEFLVQIDPHVVPVDAEAIRAGIARVIEYAMDNDIEGSGALNRDELGQLSVHCLPF